MQASSESTEKGYRMRAPKRIVLALLITSVALLIYGVSGCAKLGARSFGTTATATERPGCKDIPVSSLVPNTGAVRGGLGPDIDLCLEQLGNGEVRVRYNVTEPPGAPLLRKLRLRIKLNERLTHDQTLDRPSGEFRLGRPKEPTRVEVELNASGGSSGVSHEVGLSGLFGAPR